MNKTIEDHQAAGRHSVVMALAGKYKSVGAHEGEFTDQFAEACKDKVVIDCGAHYGYTTAVAVRHGAKLVHAFEPNEEITGDILREFFAEYPNVILHFYALSAYVGSLPLFARPESPRCLAATTTIVNNFHGPKGDWNRDVTVQNYRCETIDHAVNGPVDVIKCDTEGGEAFIFHGATETLRKYQPVIFLELHGIAPFKIKQLQELLREYGYPADFSGFKGFLGRYVLRAG